MQLALSERFLRDFQGLPKALANKCRELMNEIQRTDAAVLRQNALPGWRLHNLRGSSMVSLSVDMNFRVLAELQGDKFILHRVVKHDVADRADVNRNVGMAAIAQMTTNELSPGDIYPALCSFGIPERECEFFKGCVTEDDLLQAAGAVSEATANLALNLYETSGLVIPQSRFHVIHKDEDFARILNAGGVEWEMYLHPSQTFLVDLPASFRAAVVGSAGTGKTVCAWHRTKHLIESGVSVGFVCPHESVLDVSKRHLNDMANDGDDGSYFFVPKQPDELMQLGEAVDHMIIDEAQEIPVTWLVKLGETAPDGLGVTLFYDMNQLGGNIKKGDVTRYRRRVSDWKEMCRSFPRMRKFNLTVNYRNAREIAEYYLELLAKNLPAKPIADVPTFEAGEVVNRDVKREDLNDVVSSLLHRLLREHAASEIGVVTLDRIPDTLRHVLADRKLPVTDDMQRSGIVVTTAELIRGHERQVMIVTASHGDITSRKIGSAIDAYIAMSRAVKRLFVIETKES